MSVLWSLPPLNLQPNPVQLKKSSSLRWKKNRNYFQTSNLLFCKVLKISQPKAKFLSNIFRDISGITLKTLILLERPLDYLLAWTHLVSIHLEPTPFRMLPFPNPTFWIFWIRFILVKTFYWQESDSQWANGKQLKTWNSGNPNFSCGQLLLKITIFASSRSFVTATIKLAFDKDAWNRSSSGDGQKSILNLRHI